MTSCGKVAGWQRHIRPSYSINRCHYSNEPLLVAQNTWLRWHRSILALPRRIALLQAVLQLGRWPHAAKLLAGSAIYELHTYSINPCHYSNDLLLVGQHTWLRWHRSILALPRRIALLQAVLQLGRWPHAAKLLAGSAIYELHTYSINPCHYSNDLLLVGQHTWLRWHRSILALPRRIALLQAMLQLRRWPHAAKLLAGSAIYDLHIVSIVVTIAMSRF